MQLARRYVSYVIFFALVLITLGIWGAVWAAMPKGVLTVAIMDVGQGDAIFIESPTGVQIVIDGGPDNSVLTELPKLMPLSDRTLDAVIATHPDADHIAGFIDLLKRYSVGVFIEPGIAKETLTARTLTEEVDEKNIPRALLARGAWLDLGGGAYLKILSPDFDVSTLRSDEANEGSIVAQLVYASSTMLLMADASKETENHLLALEGKNLESDLLKVGHHGSAGSTGGGFLAAVAPEAAVISVGAKNNYGHPTEAVIGTLEAQKIKILRTDEEGTIVFVSEGKEFVRIK